MRRLSDLFKMSLQEDQSSPPDIGSSITAASSDSPPPVEPKTQGKMYKSGTEAVRDIIALSAGRLKHIGSKRGSYRISRTDPKVEVPASEMADILEKCNVEVVSIITPGALGANSGKFNTYMLRNGELHFSVVFGQGSNSGHDFEKETIDSLKNSQLNATSAGGQATVSPNSLYQILISAFNLSPEEIQKIKHVGGKKVKRPMTNQPEDVGSTISDVDFVLENGKIIHISLKNKDGRTFANSGYQSAFSFTMGPDEKPLMTPSQHDLDTFIVDGCGVNKQKVADGINDYIRHQPTDPPYKDVTTNINADIIKSYLAGAYGYGYWYLRPKKPAKQGGWQLINIDSQQAAYEQVGEIKSVLVTYPYWSPTSKSKQVTIKIYTSNAYFMVEIRNSQKGIQPNEIKVRIEKMF